MNALYTIAIVTSLMHGLCYDLTFWLIYLMCVIVWTVWVMKSRDHRANGKRKTLMQATWNGKKQNNIFDLIVESYDPTLYMVEDLNVTKTLKYIDELNASQKDVKVTMTTLFAHAIAHSLYKIKDNVGRVNFSYFKQSKGRIGTTIMIDEEGTTDTTTITVWNGHEMSLLEFCSKCKELVAEQKQKKKDG
jgi:hypothetical protein